MIQVVHGPSSYYARNFRGKDALQRAQELARRVKPAEGWDEDVTIYEVRRDGGTEGYYDTEDLTFHELG